MTPDRRRAIMVDNRQKETAVGAQAHRIQVQVEPRPVPGGPWYRCRCTCSYRSGLYSGSGGSRRAQKAGQAHVDRKTQDQERQTSQ